MARRKQQHDWERAVNRSGIAGPQKHPRHLDRRDPLNQKRQFIPLPHADGHVKITAELVHEFDADGNQLYVA